MFIGGMTGNEIKKNLHSPAVRLIEQVDKILVCPEALCHLLIVTHIIAAVSERGIKNRIDP